MSYTYTNGDGVAAMDPATPDGASEPVSHLDDAIRQIKAYLTDPAVGPDALAQAAVLASSGALKLERYCFRAVSSVDQSLPHGVSASFSQVTFTSTEFDTAPAFNLPANNFVCAKKGVYSFMIFLDTEITSGSTSGRNTYLEFRKNGAREGGVMVRDDGTNANQETSIHYALMQLNVGDTVGAFVTGLNGTTVSGRIIGSSAIFAGFLVQELP